MSIAELFDQIIQLPRQEQNSLVEMIHQHQMQVPRPDDEVFEDPSPEEILADIRLALLDIKAGRVHSFDEVMAMLKEEFDFDADQS